MVREREEDLTNNCDRRSRKKIIKAGTAVVCAGVLWIAAGIVDYYRLHRFEKPLFCVGINLADDGGSGKYVGIGYSYDIEGNFMPEDEFQGITKWTYYLLGFEMETQIRD